MATLRTGSAFARQRLDMTGLLDRRTPIEAACIYGNHFRAILDVQRITVASTLSVR